MIKQRSLLKSIFVAKMYASDRVGKRVREFPNVFLIDTQTLISSGGISYDLSAIYYLKSTHFLTLGLFKLNQHHKHMAYVYSRGIILSVTQFTFNMMCNGQNYCINKHYKITYFSM